VAPSDMTSKLAIWPKEKEESKKKARPQARFRY
jgi:hypothetical protein